MVATATADQVSIRYVPEVTLGLTPATPAFTEMIITSESINSAYTFVQSNELRADRGVSDTILTDLAVSGDINFELAYHSFEWLMEMALCNTFAAGTLDNGLLTKSVTIQKFFSDLVTPVYMSFAGCMCDKLSLTLAAGAIITGTATMSGMSVLTSTSQITGGTSTAPIKDGEIMNTSSSISAINENGVATSMNITNMTVDIVNNIRQQKVVGVLGSAGQSLGKFNVTGNLSLYFTDLVEYNKFINQTVMALDITLLDLTGNTYVINLPKVKLNSATVVASGTNTDIMVDFTYVALQDAVAGRTIRVTSTNAP